MTGFVAGVDAGASTTRAVILDGKGREVVRATGPSGLADPRWPERAAGVVEEVVRRAAAEAGASLPLDSLGAGLAGVGLEETRAAVEGALRGAGIARRVRVCTDVEAAFHGAFPQGPGILVVAGTGSVAQGRGEDGRVARTGGWGALLGDEGSGYAVGLAALRSVARARDGRGPATVLTSMVLEALEMAEPKDLVTWAAGASKAGVAALAPSVLEAARAGDAVALEIRGRAAEALDIHVGALLQALGPFHRPPALALAGGLLEPGGPLREALAEAMAPRGMPLRGQPVDAAAGAARLALADRAAPSL